MPHDVTMPQLGMTQTSGVIVRWLKAPGDTVTRGEPLFEVETDKATMEVEAQADGVLGAVTAAPGADVPIGAVIARLSGAGEVAEETAGETALDPAPDSDPDPDPDPDPASLPDGHAVIMPQLGMVQDSGVLVGWLKAPGDAVARGDALFEVETDKATQEVVAEADGYLAAILAGAGEAVPVGERVAILSPTAPGTPVIRSRAPAPGAEAAPAPVPATAQVAPPVAPTPPVAPPVTGQVTGQVTPPMTGPVTGGTGRILASPKARRLALEAGLDLARLAAAGHPQPFHVKDLDALRHLAETPAAPLSVMVADGFTGFAVWAAEHRGLMDARALLAGFAAGALGRDLAVAVAGPGGTDCFAGTARLAAVAPTDAPPALYLRDLRFGPPAPGSATTATDPTGVPVLTVIKAGDGLTVTLTAAAAPMAEAEAIGLLTGFAGRLDDPLRHLL